jgi:hypothetical protein
MRARNGPIAPDSKTHPAALSVPLLTLSNGFITQVEAGLEHKAARALPEPPSALPQRRQNPFPRQAPCR